MTGGRGFGRRRRELEARLAAAETRTEASLERAWSVARRAVEEVEALRAETITVRSQLAMRDAEHHAELHLALEHARDLAASIERERGERAAILAALTQLVARLQPGGDPNAPRPIGGTIAPGPVEVDGRIEVRSQFGSRWVSGFAVHEVVLGEEGSVGYRLRRLTDGFVLPAVFPEADVRAAESDGRRWTPVGTTLEPDPTDLGAF